ncbi:hypothetical protein CTN07_19735 [Photobacterium damselae]|nr:hypothetical protein CTN07_19735 [Photobacterium damselae]
MLILGLITLVVLFSTIAFKKQQIKTIEFPDHTKKELGLEAEYPAPMKQLQQVLTHSYIKEPSDEALDIKVGLEALNYQSDDASDDSDIKRLQLEINKLREIAAKD